MQSRGSREVARVARPFYMALGCVFIALGYVGYMLPGIPGTIFFILALWAFKRSSPRLEDWLLNKSFIGPTLRDWENEKSIRRETKILIVSILWTSILVSIAVLWPKPSAPLLVPVLLACASGVSVYIWTRKTKV